MVDGETELAPKQQEQQRLHDAIWPPPETQSASVAVLTPRVTCIVEIEQPAWAIIAEFATKHQLPAHALVRTTILAAANKFAWLLGKPAPAEYPK